MSKKRHRCPTRDQDIPGLLDLLYMSTFVVSPLQHGNTPLDVARRNGHNAVVSLLEKGSHFSESMIFKDRM